MTTEPTTLPPHYFDHIPTVDISALRSHRIEDRLRVAKAIKHAAQHMGFLYVTGHGIPQESIDNLITVTQGYFQQSLEQKMQQYIGHSVNHSGYVPEGEEQFAAIDNVNTPFTQLDDTDIKNCSAKNNSPDKHASCEKKSSIDKKESYDINFDYQGDDCRPLLGPNLWPEDTNFVKHVRRYYNEAFQVGQHLFRGFALALGLEEHYFIQRAKHPPSQLRLIHYPFDDSLEDSHTGIGAHTDYECFTILLPTAPGLEVLNPKGEWIDAPPQANALIVNIGDMLEVLSNGIFMATSHRVRRVNEARYAFPLFCACDYDTLITPIPDLAPRNPNRTYAPLICGEHIYAQTIQSFCYLKKRLHQGKIELPKSDHSLSSFGQIGITKSDSNHAS